MNKKKILRALVLIAMVAVIAVIWAVKNSGNRQNANMNLTEENSATADILAPFEIDHIDLDEILSHGLPVILDFGSESCGPCREMAPVLEKVHDDMQGKAVIQYADIWNSPQAAEDSRNFPVQVIPTQFFYTADGKPYVPGEDIPVPFTMYSHKETKEHLFTVHEGGLTEEQMLLILKDMDVK